MNRHTIALVGAATAMLMSAAALATAAGDAPTTIEACRNTRHGLVRIVFSANACKSNETHVSWDVEGPAGPAGPRRPGRASRPEGGFRVWDQLGRRACRDGLQDVRRRQRPRRGRLDGHRPDHADVRDGRVAAASSTGNARLVINEVDYDQVGADTGGFVEIANTGTAAATLDGTALVLVNGGDGTEYGREDADGHARGRSEARRRRRSPERRPGRRWRSSTRRRTRCSMRSATRGRSTRPRSTPRRSTWSRAPCFPSTSPTRTPSTARSRASPTARTRTTRPPTGRSRRRRRRERRT